MPIITITAKYVRKETYTLQEIFPYIVSVKETRKEPSKATHIFDDDCIRMTSMRYQVFKHVSHKCRKCGLEGKFFAKEKNKCQEQDTWHFNLYGYNAYGHEVMLTKDHIKPKAKGGTDSLMNLDCLCINCNSAKGDDWDGTSGC